MKRQFCLVFTFILVIFSILLSLSKGSTSIPLYQLLFADNSLFNTIFFELRLPRTMTAFIAGGLLGMAGSLIQLLFQNPLADPYVLGISGAGALGTLFLVYLGYGESAALAGAWFASLGTLVFIFALSKKHRWHAQALLLLGIALASSFSACISLLFLIAPERSLHSMLFWLAGDLNNAHMPWLSFWIFSAGMILALFLGPSLNIFGRGELEAQTLGLPVKKYRVLLYLLSSLFTAAAITIAGCISFIGLIIPQLTRLLFGYDHRFSLPLSALLGGILLTLADTLSRILFAPQQLPVGIIITLMGAPIFIWLVKNVNVKY